MNTRRVRFLGQDRVVFASARVTDEGDHFGGTIDLESAPPAFLALLDEFEEIVDGQMFAFLDEIREKIDSIHIKAVFDDGDEADVGDFQAFPSTGDVSFRLAREASGASRPS